MILLMNSESIGQWSSWWTVNLLDNDPLDEQWISWTMILFVNLLDNDPLDEQWISWTMILRVNRESVWKWFSGWTLNILDNDPLDEQWISFGWTVNILDNDPLDEQWISWAMIIWLYQDPLSVQWSSGCMVNFVIMGNYYLGVQWSVSSYSECSLALHNMCCSRKCTESPVPMSFIYCLEQHPGIECPWLTRILIPD